MSKIIVQKYGGSSLHDTKAILAVAERISASHSDELSIVAVVSAMGSTTDELTNLAFQLNKNPDQYTWWSNRGRAWEKNVGWRIDYQIATKKIGTKATSVSIYKEKRFSDHSPLIIDYDYIL